MRLRVRASVVLAAASLATLAEPAAAQEGIFQGMQKGVEFTTSTNSTTTTFANGLVTKTETRTIFPTLRLSVDTLVYPKLRLNTGGVFEVNMQSTNVDASVADSTITRNRPYFLLRSTDPVFSPGFGYFRREDRSRTAGLSNIKLVNDEYDGYLGWNPAGGPRTDFQAIRAHTFDGTRTFQDLERAFGSVISNYARGNFGATYRGSYLDTNNRVRRLDTTQIAHSGRLTDSGVLIRRRLVWNATYNLNYQDIRTIASANDGEVDIPITPFAALAALSDTPLVAKLSQNGLLVDGNLTGSAGLDIGLVTPPAETQARNIGLDFLNPTGVNRLLVWVDRDLPVAVSNSFSWEVYSSPDNVLWARETIVSAAPFGPFENRFELAFPRISARYIKVVTRPLSPGVPESSKFPNIFVTEIQAFSRQSAEETGRRVTETIHLLNTDWRLRILDGPALFYEGFYLYNGTSREGARTTTLSNGVSMNSTFARIFSVYGRATREQGTEFRGDRVATVTNATFTVDPIPAFRSSFLYSGQDERIAGLPSDRHGFFVQNSAQVYRGVDVLFGVGWSMTTRETGEAAHDRLLNASAIVTPRQHINITFNYDETASNRSGPFVGSSHLEMRRVYGAVALDPIPTFHLVLGEEVITTPDQPTRTTFDVNVNWTPFPDGALQFIVARNQQVRSLEFGIFRNTTGTVRWNLSRRSYLDVTYQRATSEFVIETTDSRTFVVTLRLFT